MIRLDKNCIAETILAAPGWARLGITESKAELRTEAAKALAEAIWEKLGGGRDAADARPMAPSA